MSLCGVLAVSVAGTVARADACDYRLSRLIGGQAAAVGIGGSATAAATGTAGTALGFYTLVHSTSGLTMLGWTAAGGSAAGTVGTVGIIGGTGGAVGSTAAAMMWPVTIVATAVAAAGGGAYEGVCFLMIDRVTDYDEVLPIVQNIAANADPDRIRYIEATTLEDYGGPAIVVTDEDGVSTEYAIENLYIADGELRNHDWFLNTSLGSVNYVMPAPAD